MDFDIPADLAAYLDELDAFIEREIVPLEQQDDNIRFFDHRREDARTDWDRGGLPNEEWEALLAEARRRADAAGHYRYPFPEEYGGRGGTNLGMAIIREHLAHRGLGPAQRPAERALDRRQQRGPAADAGVRHRGEQKAEWVDGLAEGRRAASPSASPSPSTAPTPPTWRPAAVRDGDELGDQRREDLEHRCPQGPVRHGHGAHQRRGRATATGITAFLVPMRRRGLRVEEMLWTFNMPTDHGRVSLHERAGGRRRDLRRRGPRPGRWSSTSSTRTASARRPRASAPPSSASTSRSPTRRSASPSASPSPPIRASSSRWSSSRPSARCCARSSTRRRG